MVKCDQIYVVQQKVILSSGNGIIKNIKLLIKKMSSFNTFASRINQHLTMMKLQKLQQLQSISEKLMIIKNLLHRLHVELGAKSAT